MILTGVVTQIKYIARELTGQNTHTQQLIIKYLKIQLYGEEVRYEILPVSRTPCVCNARTTDKGDSFGAPFS